MRLRVLLAAALPLALGACHLVLPEPSWPQTGFSQWTLRLGGTGADVTWPKVASDPEGNVYVAGLFSGRVSFGGGEVASPSRDRPSGFVVKLDRDSVHRWTLPILAQGGVSNIRVSARSGEVLVSAGFTGSASLGSVQLGADDGKNRLLIAKLGAADGSVTWSQAWTGEGALRGGASLHPTGDISVHGHFSGSSLSTPAPGGLNLVNADTTGMTADLFVARMSPSGGITWLRGYGDGQSQQVYGTGTVDTAGNSVLLTSFFGTPAIERCTPPPDATSMFVKLDARPECLYGVSFTPQGPAGSQAALWYAASTKGQSTVVAGGLMGTVAIGLDPVTSRGQTDVLLVKVDAFGAVTMVKTFGDASDNEINGLAVDGSDNIYVASTGGGSIDFGGGTLQSAGDLDVFVARLDPAGEHVWSRRFGDTREQVASSLAVDPDGNLLVVGHFSGIMDLGSGSMEAQGIHDVFVARLGP